MIRFGEWLPDIAALESPGLTEAMNVLATVEGYEQWPALDPFSLTLSASAGDDSLSWCLGAGSFKSFAGTAYTYAGNGRALYRLTGTTWDRFTRTATSSASNTSTSVPYSTGVSSYWEFEQYGAYVVATNYDNWPQYHTLGAATRFLNLTDKYRWRHQGVVREFLMVGDLYEKTSSASTGRALPQRIRWSALGAITTSSNWISSSVTQADYQDLPSQAGTVQAVKGGEYGVIVCENSVFRASYSGPPVIFQIDETLPGVGTPFPRSVCQHGDTVFLLSHDGFLAIVAGAQVQRIGANKVDRTVLSEISGGYNHRVIGVVDAQNLRVFWIYPTQSAIGGRPNRIVAYDIRSGRWTRGSDEVWYVFRALSNYTSLDDLSAAGYTNLDTLPASLDSPFWMGGRPFLGVFDDIHRLGEFNASAMAATIETGEVQLAPGFRSHVRKLRPLVDATGGTLTMQVGFRNRQQDGYTWNTTATVNSTGDCMARVNARYHRARLSISGDFSRALGIDIDFVREGSGR